MIKLRRAILSYLGKDAAEEKGPAAPPEPPPAPPAPAEAVPADALGLLASAGLRDLADGLAHAVGVDRIEEATVAMVGELGDDYLTAAGLQVGVVLGALGGAARGGGQPEGQPRESLCFCRQTCGSHQDQHMYSRTCTHAHAHKNTPASGPQAAQVAKLRQAIACRGGAGRGEALAPPRRRPSDSGAAAEGEALPTLVETGTFPCAGALAALAGVAVIQALTIAHLDEMTVEQWASAGVKVRVCHHRAAG